MNDNEQTAVGKQAAQFMTSVADQTEAVFYAAEQVLHSLADDAGGNWENGHVLKLDPQEAMILRLAGYRVAGDVESKVEIQRAVGRVRIEQRLRRSYRGKEALEEAKRAAREAQEREERDREQLERTISDAQDKLNQLGEATRVAVETRDQMLKAKEELANYVPPFIRQRYESAVGAVKRSPLKVQLNALEGRKHQLDEKINRLGEWQETYTGSDAAEGVVVPDKPPALTLAEEHEYLGLGQRIAVAKAAMQEAMRDGRNMIDDFVEHGYRAPAA